MTWVHEWLRSKPKAGRLQRMVIEALLLGPATKAELAQRIGRSAPLVGNALYSLRKRGVVLHGGSSQPGHRGGLAAVWRLAPRKLPRVCSIRQTEREACEDDLLCSINGMRGRATMRQLVEDTGRCENVVRKALQRMAEDGRVRRLVSRPPPGERVVWATPGYSPSKEVD